MRTISWRAQLWLVALGYAAVLVVAAALILARYLLELNHRADVAGAGGMYGAGDLFLGIFILCLFMVPTFFLVWSMARFEAYYTSYSKFLLCLSMNAPVCLGLFLFSDNHVAQIVSFLSLCRLVLSPFVFVGVGVSRLLAQFHRAKELTSYALIIEGLTLGIAVVLLIRK